MVEGTTIRGVLETCLYADDLDACASFYENVIGLDVFSRVAGRHVFFRCGDAMFLLFQPQRTASPDASAPPHGSQGPGHVCFAIRDADVDTWRDRLHSANLDIEAETTWPRGGRSLYFRDPAGNSVELASPQIWGLPDSSSRTIRSDIA